MSSYVAKIRLFPNFAKQEKKKESLSNKLLPQYALFRPFKRHFLDNFAYLCTHNNTED